jgi:hypothetical protein
LKVDVQLNPTVTDFTYSLLAGGIEVEDTTADRNTINVTTAIAGRQILVSSVGDIVSAFEAAADYNKYNKNILAGDTEVVAEYSLYSKYEAVNVGKAVVTFSNENVDASTLDVQLRYNGVQVAQDPTWSAT